jgi:hypothetical protein
MLLSFLTLVFADELNCSICEAQLPFAYIEYLLLGPYQISRGQDGMRRFCVAAYSGHEYDLCLAIAVDRYPDTVEYFSTGFPQDKICSSEKYCPATKAPKDPAGNNARLADNRFATDLFSLLQHARNEAELKKTIDDLATFFPVLHKIQGHELTAVFALLQRNSHRTFAWYIRDLLA